VSKRAIPFIELTVRDHSETRFFVSRNTHSPIPVNSIHELVFEPFLVPFGEEADAPSMQIDCEACQFFRDLTKCPGSYQNSRFVPIQYPVTSLAEKQVK
jgi:hypothetical protein